MLCYPCNLPFQISQRFGENPDFYSKLGMKAHNGVDFSIPVGTPIYATHDGTVWMAGTMSDGALQVAIDSLDGTFRTFYAHLSEFKCKPGDKVKKGQLIALSGNTGRYTTGPHLHYGYHPISNYADTEPNNGYNGATDPFRLFDGTYPSDYAMKTTPKHVTDFLSALTKYQQAEGIKPFPKIGPLTKKSLTKYGII